MSEVDGRDEAEVAAEAEAPPVLTAPADGVPPVVEDREALAATIAALAAGHGPVAVDAERAQGYRYGAEAYLIQLRRAGSGTHLVDPRAFAVDGEVDLSGLAAPIADAEWVIHAASQDLPCLAAVRMVPGRLFDTELAGRLLNRPRVGLGALVEVELGHRLLKEHSAADWSRRPIPEEWLNYAALDVELLLELREVMGRHLEGAGKSGWAEQEFAALAAAADTPPPVRVDPWRRTSGIHGVRTPTGMAVVRELWLARDEIARSSDRAPGRVLPDAAIAELAARDQPTATDVDKIAGFRRRTALRHRDTWVAALERARALTRRQLPPLHLPSDAPPPPRTWDRRDPVAAARWERVRPAVLALAEEHDLPVENLLSPALLRELAWRPPSPLAEPAVEQALAGSGARAWQRELVVPVVAPLLDDALTDPAVLERAGEPGERSRRRHP